jgi:hypothetical protein
MDSPMKNDRADLDSKIDGQMNRLNEIIDEILKKRQGEMRILGAPLIIMTRAMLFAI